MTEERALRGVFLARPASGGDTWEALRALAAAEGFGPPEELMTLEPAPGGWDRLAVFAELGENLLACARWRGVLEIRRERPDGAPPSAGTKP